KEKRSLRATVLSGGESKMLSVAKELVTEPSLLLVDEPSAGLAPRIAEQVYERLREVQAAGVTILLVDQNITKAVEVSDYLYMLEIGRVRREGPRLAFADPLWTHLPNPSPGTLTRPGPSGGPGCSWSASPGSAWCPGARPNTTRP